VVKVSNGTGNESESIVQYINSASDWLDRARAARGLVS
jgi:hypothetical protein